MVDKTLEDLIHIIDGLNFYNIKTTLKVLKKLKNHVKTNPQMQYYLPKEWMIAHQNIQEIENFLNNYAIRSIKNEEDLSAKERFNNKYDS